MAIGAGLQGSDSIQFGAGRAAAILSALAGFDVGCRADAELCARHPAR